MTTKELTTIEEKHLVLEGDPEQQLAYAQKAAKALLKVVQSKKDKVIIQGKQYLTFEDWQTVARFYGVSVGIEWTKPVTENGLITGYEARAVATRQGEQVSAAEAMCMTNERNWTGRPLFMIRSMAQTRASAKALRNLLAWVVVMAGLPGTPAEEMDGLENAQNRVGRTKQSKVDTYASDVQTAQGAQKQVIFRLLKKLQVPEKEMSEWVEKKTDLKLVPENYDEIINRLDILIKER